MTDHLHLLPRLGMTGTVSLLPIHAFIAMTVITLTLPMEKAELECHHHHYCCCCRR